MKRGPKIVGLFQFTAIIVLLSFTVFTQKASANYLFYNADTTREVFSNTVEAPNLYVPGSIGVRTANPGAGIESYGSGPGLYLNQGSAADIYMRYHVPGIRWWTVGPKANGDFWFSNTSDHSGSVPFAILTGGNVGIGTTTPTQKFNVYGSGAKILLSDTNVTEANKTSLLIGATAANPAVWEVAATDNSGTYATRTPYLAFKSGNVGIGTTAPGAKLEILNQQPGAHADYVLNKISDIYNAGANGQHLFLTGSTATGPLEFNFLNDWGIISFGSSVTGQATPKRDLVISNGNIGIGTAGPIAGLDVQKPITASAGVANGVNLQQTLTAAANGDTLSALNINPTFVVGAYDPVNRYAINANGTIKATAFSGALSGTVNAGNISSGSFGGNTTGGVYGFPNKLSIGYELGSTPTSLSQTGTLAVSGNVGIGTVTPVTQLEIYKSLATNATLQPLLTLTSDYGGAAGTGFGSTIVFRGRTAGNLMQDNAKIAGYNPDASDNGYSLGFFTAPSVGVMTERLTITRSGNVGIGINGPGSILHLYGDSSSKIMSLIIQDTNVGYPKTWRLGNDGQLGKFGLMDGTSANYRWIVDGVGNVGIGTTTPAQKLDVSGGVRMTTLNQGGGINERFYPNVVSTNNDGTATTGAWIINTPIPRTSNLMFRIRVHGYAYGNQNSVDFTIVGYPYNASIGNVDGHAGSVVSYNLQDTGTDGLAKYVGINSSGNVAIAFGSTALSSYYYRFSVDGWITRTAADRSSGWSITQSTVANFGFLDINGPLTSSLKNTIFVDSNGNVGIAKSAPTTALDVNGTVTASSFSGPLTGTVTAGNVSSGAFGNSTTGGVYGFPDKLSVGYGLGSTPTTQSQTGMLAVFGNVGIGTVTPLMKLDIYGTGGSPAVSGTAPTGSARFQSSASNNVLDIGTTAASPFGVWLQGTDRTNLALTYPILLNPSGGNVGIGTTNPLYKLDVGTSHIFAVDTSAIIYNNNITLSSSGTNLQIGKDSTGWQSMSFFTGGNASGNERIRIDNTGNIGIGTTGPTSLLHVAGSQPVAVAANGTAATQVLQITGGKGGNTTGTTGQTGGIGAVLNLTGGAGGDAPSGSTNGAGGGVTLQGGAAGSGLGAASTYPYGSVVLQPNGGNVGIGTTTPGYKLEVASGGALTANFGTGATDTVLIGGGQGKLTVGIVDPVYTIDGKRFATYSPSMTGAKEETAGIIRLAKKDGKLSGMIDFSKAEESSDLWLFYQITDFGAEWKNLSILLSSGFNGKVWYEKDFASKRIFIYGTADELSDKYEVSYRLTASRFDHENWSNISHDDVEGFRLESKK